MTLKCSFSFFPPKDKTTKPMASVTNANTSSTQAAPVAVTTPTVSSGQPTPTSPIKKVRQNCVC